MNDILSSVLGVGGAIALNAVSGAQIRDEVSAWVTLIGSVAITMATIGIQVYRLIRDRDKTEKKNKEDKSEEEDTDDE